MLSKISVCVVVLAICSHAPLTGQDALPAKVKSKHVSQNRLIDQSEIRDLVKKLASETEWEDAQQRLISAGRASAAELFKALGDSNKQVAARVLKTLRALPKANFSLRDAADNNLAHVKVEFYEVLPNTERMSKQPFATRLTDISGGISLSSIPAKQDIALKVHLPKYETTTITRLSADDVAEMKSETRSAAHRRVWLPVVLKDFQYAERAVEGVVLDELGKPVTGAEISCQSISAENSRTISFNRAIEPISSVVTGKTGYFRIYMPGLKPAVYMSRRYIIPETVRKEPVPKGGKYSLIVRVPDDLTLCPQEVDKPNTSKATIRLKRTDHNYQLEFESLSGKLITDKSELAKITLRYQPPGSARFATWTEIDQDIVMNGGPMHTGRYRASYKKKQFEDPFFWKIKKINGSSPKKLRFPTPPPVIFRGRVIDGTNGKPLAGIFVGGCNGRSSDRYLSTVTSEEWDSAEKLPKEPLLNAKAIKPFLNVYNFRKIVRTDKTGCFQLAQQPDDRFYGIIVFARHKLQSSTRVYRGNWFRDILDVPLFPAARIRMRSSKQNSQFSVGWSTPSDGQPKWFSTLKKQSTDFIHPKTGIHISRSTGVSYNLRGKKDLWMKVPAGLRFRLEGGTSPPTPFKRNSGDFFPLDYKAYLLSNTIYRFDEGKEIELGEVPLEEAILVFVEVVSPKGKPVKDVEVRHLGKRGVEGIWSLSYKTDDRGLVQFHVLKNARHVFAAMPDYFLHTKEHFENKIEVKTEGVAPKKPFQIRLSKDQFQILSGK